MNMSDLDTRQSRASDRIAPRPLVVRDRSLERAIANDLIDLHFQPQSDPRTGHVAGAEALARWAGADSSESLFARAAAVGLTERLSRHIQARAGYDDWLVSELGEAGLDPARLTLEITESSLVMDRVIVSTRLARLRALGIEIAIDDFGTGYANLAYLTSLPLDVLKIDRGLVDGLVGGSRDRIVVKAMIGMARELGLKVVVEGIETTAQLALVADWGCDLYQGFLVAGALDEAELGRFVATSQLVAA